VKPAEALVLRADGGASAGIGHVMRCLALAQAWQDSGGRARFAAAMLPPALADRLARESIPVDPVDAAPGSAEDAAATAEAAARAGAAWIVADGYWIEPAYQRALRARGRSLLFVDDAGESGPYEADLVLNQNLHATEPMYRDRRPGTGLLLGPRFALLRREFAARRGTEREIPNRARRILVTLGGGDLGDLTRRVVRALARSGEAAEVRVLIGPAHPRAERIRSEVERLKSGTVLPAAAEELPELFAWADLAVTAGGSTCWEMAFSGLPFVAVAAAPNQVPIARSLDEAGAARYAGWHESLDDAALAELVEELTADAGARARMSRAGRALVDGRGAERVVERVRTAKAA
jgi:UDP-2,4-diacetamido-2,4,6-trideoxy-beta-L-altropyranose hydrolase